jgi:uncharacterized integral membrane protein
MKEHRIFDAMIAPDQHGESLEKDPQPRDRRARGLQRGVPSTRTSVSWTFVAVAIVATVIVLVFILENLHATDATFFGIHWRIPLGLDLLLAALLGAIAVFVVGAARTLQLRLLTRRTMRARDAQVSAPGVERAEDLEPGSSRGDTA